jgi:eukaryotic-like serine/threonine-protein kinase
MAEAVARAAPLPERIGRHQVIGYLATGGMAELFLAKEPTGRPVVIKRILPHLARQTAFVSMFIDEARIGSRAKHPNLVEVYELGQVGTDLFLVMEFLVGENLAGVVRRLVKRDERMSYGLAAYLIAEVCDGLHAAHELTDEAGHPLELVHRDVSPQNVFVTFGGDVKLLDFGVATAAQRLTQTASGEVKGKYAYMSPEQARGEPLDRRSDIFSLGVVLYELTTLRRLFKRPNELQVLRAITEEPIPRPTREVPEYPPCIEAICTRALARDPAQRYPTAAAMREDLLAAMQTVGLEGDPHEAIASKLARLFSERLAEKRELMERVYRGADLGDLPAAEVDEGIDVPLVQSATAASSLSKVRGDTAPPADGVRSSRTSRASRRGLVAAFLVAILAGGGVGGYLRLQDRAAAEVAAATPESVPSRAGAAVEQDEVVGPIIEHVQIEIETDPPGVTVALGGEVRGQTPLELREPRGDSELELELRAPGFASAAQMIVPDRDQRLHFSLIQQEKRIVVVKQPPKKSPGRGKRGGGKPDESPGPEAGSGSGSGSGTGFRRFD